MQQPGPEGSVSGRREPSHHASRAPQRRRGQRLDPSGPRGTVPSVFTMMCVFVRPSGVRPRATLLLGALLACVAAGPAAADDDGLVTVTLAVPKDSGAARAAVLSAPALRDAFAGDTRFTLSELESLLDQTGAPPAEARLAEAQRLKSKADLALSIVDLPVAADAYASALVAFEQGAAAVTDVTDIVDCFDKQAITFALQGDRDAATSAWKRAIALDPGFRVSADAAPRVQKIFEGVLKEYKDPPQGQLTVYSTTGAAEVWIDGVPRGASPITVDIPAGRHLVRVYREGFRAWGGAVEVKKAQEATAQAALKPTKGYAKLDELLTRFARNPDADDNVADIARFLKVDRVLLAVVEAEGTIATIRGAAVDAVAGRVLGRAEKSVPVDGDFFARDVTRLVRERLLQPLSERAEVTLSEEERRRGRLSGPDEEVETPGAVVGGWVLTLTSVIPIGAGVGLGIATLNQSAAYRSRTQVDPQLAEIKNAWFFSAVGADVAYVVGAGMLTGGILLLVNGYGEQSAREEVLRPGASSSAR